MVVIEGLDRTDSNPFLAGMSDELHAQHTKEINDLFLEAQLDDPELSFTDFVRPYRDGTRMTQAMIFYQEMKQQKALQEKGKKEMKKKKVGNDSNEEKVVKKEWPELMKQSGDQAKKVIEKERPDLKNVVVVKDGSMMTMDFREDRVRIFVDDKGKVCKVPKVM